MAKENIEFTEKNSFAPFIIEYGPTFTLEEIKESLRFYKNQRNFKYLWERTNRFELIEIE